MDKFSHKQIAVVIPHYNEQDRLYSFLCDLIQEFKTISWAKKFLIVIVDDASKKSIDLEKIASLLKEEPGSLEFYSLKHALNLGQGAALETGFEFLRRKDFQGLTVTMDADGQHSPSDLKNLLQPILKNECDIVFGNRFLPGTLSNVPILRKQILKLAVKFEALLTGLNLSDAHNGYRAFNTKALHILKLKQARMAHASEIKFLVAKNKLRYTEAPVSIHYSQETLAKGQTNLGALKILKELLRAYFFDRD